MTLASAEGMGVRPPSSLKLPAERTFELKHPILGFSDSQRYFVSEVSRLTGVKKPSLSDAIGLCGKLEVDDIFRIQSKISLIDMFDYEQEKPMDHAGFPLTEAHGGLLIGFVGNDNARLSEMKHDAPHLFSQADTIGILHVLPFGQAYPEKGFEKHIGNLMLFDLIRLANSFTPEEAKNPKIIYANYTNSKNARFLHRSLGLPIDKIYTKGKWGKIEEAPDERIKDWLAHPKSVDAASILLHCSQEELCNGIKEKAQRYLDFSLKASHTQDPVEYEKQLRVFSIQMSLSQATPFLSAFYRFMNKTRK